MTELPAQHRSSVEAWVVLAKGERHRGRRTPPQCHTLQIELLSVSRGVQEAQRVSTATWFAVPISFEPESTLRLLVLRFFLLSFTYDKHVQSALKKR